MTFPTPHTVGHAVFNGNGEDGLGNDAESWLPPVNVKVIGYQPGRGFQPGQTESNDGHTARVVTDVDLLIPPTLHVSIRDRFTLPGEVKPYEVVSVEDYNHGFHGWKPGSVVTLKLVTG